MSAVCWKCRGLASGLDKERRPVCDVHDHAVPAATPAQSLAEHDAALIERCVGIVALVTVALNGEQLAERRALIDAIRALKGRNS